MPVRARERAALGRAVLASLLVHAALLGSLPGPHDAGRLPIPLRVRVQHAADSAPPPVLEPPGSPVIAAPAPTAQASRRSAPTPHRPGADAAARVAAAYAPPPDARLADAATVAQYRLLVIARARGAGPYPLAARERGWQGRVEVRVSIDDAGQTESITLHSGSGYALLDEAALDTIRDAARRAPAPPALRGQRFVFDVPMIFSLADAAR